MAVQPSDSLLAKIKDQNRYRDASWARLGASVVPSVVAGQQGGVAAARATSDAFYPHNPAGLTQQDKLGLKLKTIQDWGKMAKDLNDGKIGIADAISKGHDNFKTLVDAFAREYGDKSSANASVASSFNAGLANLVKSKVDVMQEVAKSANIANQGSVMRSFEILGPKMGQGDPATATEVKVAIDGLLATGDQAGAAALTAMLDQAAHDAGAGSLQEYMAGMAGADPAAAGVIDRIGQLHGQIQDIQNGLTAEMEKTFRGGLAALKTGVAGNDDLVDKVLSAMDKMNLSTGDPEELVKTLESAFEIGVPDGASPIEATKKLLDQIDAAGGQLPGNLAEARRQLLADPEFQNFKRENKFATDEVALRELRRMASMKHAAMLESDKRQVAKRKADDVGPFTGPPSSPAAKLTGIPVRASGQAQEQAGFKVVRDPQGKLHLVGEDGMMRDPTPEDLDHLAEMADKDPAAYQASIRPPSEFLQLQTASNQANSRTLIQGAHDRLAEERGTPPAAAPPTSLAGTLTAGLVGALKKRKKKAPPIAGEMTDILENPESP